MATQVILLERVDNLGEIGDVVAVKPGYARNFLLPQKKALRASKDNIAYFEAKKKALLADNDKKRKEAETTAKKIEGLKVALIRQASEAGQLFGSVSSRDIAKALAEQSKQDITRNMVQVNQSFKSIGLFEIEVALHAEVKVPVIVNIARTEEEATIQAETGKALIADNNTDEEPVAAEEEVQEAEQVDAQLEEVLEEGALEAEKEKQAQAKAKEAEDEAKAQAKAEAKAAKVAAAAEEEAEGAAVAEDASEEKAKDEEQA